MAGTMADTNDKGARITSAALARTLALTFTAPDLLTTGAKRTEPNAELLEDLQHSITEGAATRAALELTTAVVDAIAISLDRIRSKLLRVRFREL